MEGAQSVVPLPRAGTRRRSVPVFKWVRDRVATTPGQLTLIAALVVLGAFCCGLVATFAERSRAQAANAAQGQTEPLLAQAVKLYSGLSDANATVTTALLSGGLEPPLKRARYELDLRAASSALTTLTREADTSPVARHALAVISQALPVYTGLVESARANNRQGFPVGAAYLRQASGLLTGTMLPATDRLYATEASRLGEDYGTGTATGALVAFVAAVAISLALLLLAQRYVARVSRRTFNLPMVAATVVLLAIAVWGTIGLLNEQSALGSARRDGSDSVEVLSATQVLASRAQGDQSLALVNRGSDASDALDFGAVMQRLSGTDGLVAEASSLAQRTGTAVAANRLAGDFAAYRAETAHITSLQNSGKISTAIAAAPAASARSDQLGTNLSDLIGAAQGRFTRSAANATSSLSGLSIAIPLLIALAAVLALIGLRQRINEYR